VLPEKVKRKMNKKYMVLLSVVLLSATVAGVAYAHWTDKLWVRFEIDTGRLHLKPFLCTETTYANDWPDYVTEKTVWFNDHSDEVDEREDSDTYTWEKEWFVPTGLIRTWETSDLDQGFDISLGNVYPCLNAEFCLGLENDGTIPAGYNGVDLLYLTEGGDTLDMADYVMIKDLDLDDGHGSILVYDLTTTTDWPMCEITIDLYADVPEKQLNPNSPHSWAQIDPGYKVWSVIKIHFNEGLKQDATYTFGFKIYYVNWNEVGVGN
jgi:hypothetical protein